LGARALALGSKPKRSSSSPVRPSIACWLTGTRAETQAAAFAGARLPSGASPPLAVIRPGGDPAEPARDAIRAKLTGVVLEGDFSPDATERVRAAALPRRLSN